MELKKIWVKNFKSLRDAVEFPTRLTFVVGPSGSGKTALVESFEVLRGGRAPADAAVGVEVRHGGCGASYEVAGGGANVVADCGADGADGAVRRYLESMVVVREVNWKAVRSLQPAVGEERLLPDASNFLRFLYAVTGGDVPEHLTDGGVLVLKLTTEDGATLTQATAPSGALKVLILETALMAQPAMVVVDEFENSLDPEAQQFLMDELRSRGVYAVLTTNSHIVLDYVKTPKEVVVLRLVGGETKARRLGGEVEDMLRHKLTLSGLMWSGLLEPLLF
jgi:energy-coupling factor transporter ATP-binding protein EcfA2